MLGLYHHLDFNDYLPGISYDLEIFLTSSIPIRSGEVNRMLFLSIDNFRNESDLYLIREAVSRMYNRVIVLTRDEESARLLKRHSRLFENSLIEVKS